MNCGKAQIFKGRKIEVVEGGVRVIAEAYPSGGDSSIPPIPKKGPEKRIPGPPTALKERLPSSVLPV